MTQFKKFDASEYLHDEEDMLEFLAAAMEDENPDVFISALGHVAKARGMAQIAETSGLGRESLYKALKPGSKLRYETMHKIIHALGFRMTLSAA
ncbi:putative addiction module antidote protein [Rhizobium skierniewicense]|uniref:Putative addiction module antidote protein n=1 Tax=Rhizobium skierniewicense TaxID=984260 RepID=A0A7W6G3P6_9HYPH|nr:addiction module antidote protein [Rhizobium skierniewicense]MBB3948423.1 putative addiction module antidote protein [Rhizobium skierniewicense]